ncbi:hypothetical protein CRI93_05995 [Longimonas halophila]|uniref:Uncharacterized protein n=1 Tax=Longimonas halophila TaxID=1469170 RepID=A0A2H3P6N2_9BACT|nr:hypothetical protein CRI93_05995 [Longimonas halophila]
MNAAFAQGETQSSTEIPDEVTSYVDAQNFVAAFSTPRERYTLVQYESPASVWRETGSERLVAVFERIKHVHTFEQRSGPHPMVRWFGARREHVPRPELLTIEDVNRVSATEMMVLVTVYALEPQTNTQFIEGYERHGFGLDDVAEARIPVTTREVQYWTKHNGTWVKSETTRRYLDVQD